MRHTAVKYVSLSLVLLFVAASALFRGSVERSRSPAPGLLEEVSKPRADSREGRDVFERRCASCHDVDELTTPFDDAVDRALAAVEMLDFLDGHSGSSAAEDRRIVAYLLQGSRGDR